MPDLRAVLPDRYVTEESPDTAVLLELTVTAVRLNTGSPCDGHSAMFETWPGPEQHVKQWFVLENGKAVAINEDPDGDWTYPVIDYAGDNAA